MNREEIVNRDVYGTKSGRRLFKILRKSCYDAKSAEDIILLFDTEDKRQRLIEYLE